MPRIRGSHSKDKNDTNNDDTTTKNADDQDEKNIAKDVVEGESSQGNEAVGETTDRIRKWPENDPAKQHKHEKKPADLDKSVNTNGDGDGNGDNVPVETDVVYPADLDEELEKEKQEQEISSPCPPLFLETSSDFETLPPFPQRLICNADESIGTHPALYFTAFLTILFFCYCVCSRKRGRYSYFRRRRGGHDSKSRGEYTPLDVVYDELLDDLEDGEMSSCLQDSDDDSVGTIISQWSEGGVNGSNGPGKIELSNFNDDRLSLAEMNG